MVIYCYVIRCKKDLIRFRERSEQEISTGEADLPSPAQRPVAKRPVAPLARPLNISSMPPIATCDWHFYSFLKIFRKPLAQFIFFHYLCKRNQMKTVKTLHFDFIFFGVSLSLSFG